MPKEVEHPQVTEDQVELWLANPVTVALLRCFEWKRLDSVENGGTGRLADSSNADLTHAMLHREFGKQDAFTECKTPEAVLDEYVMIFHPPEEDETDGQ